MHEIHLMGILNVTPDSFSDGGLYADPESALDRALLMREEGADILDIGAESSRPGADPVSADEELKRLLPVLRKIVPKIRIPVSVDTRKASVARAVLAEGASWINDISALGDPDMASTVADAGASVILMHRKGEPKTMQREVFYDDVIEEILIFLGGRIRLALQNGIARGNILIDPGIGFGKRPEDNLRILNELNEFKKLECPIVFGSSRKSFVRRMFGERPDQILKGSVETAVLAARRGASVLRVHDVKETKAAL